MTRTLVTRAGMPPAATYCLHLADDALVMAQRTSEWLTRAPQIEEDMALGNIALDHLGQARTLLSRAGVLSAAGGGPAYDEDDLAYWRDGRDFTNVQLVETVRGDFAVTIVRLLVFAVFQQHRYAALRASSDEIVAGVAGKGVKEVTYHRDHAEQWTLRLGLGTDESRARMLAALEVVAPYVDELFDDDGVSVSLIGEGISVLPSSLRAPVLADVDAVLGAADLARPEPTWRSRDGREGVHSTELALLLAEMQHLARSHPDATW